MFLEALRIEIATAGGPDALRRVARALLDRACGGELAAIDLIAERLDGKVPQAIGGSDELGPQRLEISWRETAPRIDDNGAVAVHVR